MVSNDMSDDDSVLDPEETRAESDDDEDNDAAFEKENGYDEGYGSDAQEHEDDLAVPDGDDDDDEDDDGPGVPASWVREREEARQEAAAKKEKEKKEVAAPPPKKDKEKSGGPTLLSHFTKQNGGSKEASTSRAPAPAVKAVQPKVPLGASRPKGGAKAATSAAAKEAPRKAAAAATSAAPASKQKASAEQPFSFNNESEDDEAPLASTMAKNAGYGASIATVDAVQEYEDRMTAEAARAPEESEPAQGAEPPRVHEAAKKRRYVMKNEKTKKWCEYKVAGLLFAQESSDLFELTMEDTTIGSVKERVAMQTKLADEEMSKMLATLLIGEMKVDGSGSGSGPGITNLMGAIPNELPLSETEREDVRSKMKDCDSEVELVQLIALDHSIMKRLFKVSNHSALPGIYNPNNNSSNKYRVPSKLEEQKEFDDNFEFIGTIDTVKKARSSGKRSSDEANGGSSGSKADGKRPATAAAMGAATEADEERPMTTAGWYKMKPLADAEFNAYYTELRCGMDEQFTVVPSGPGKFLLRESPRPRA